MKIQWVNGQKIHHSPPYSYGDSAGLAPDFPFNLLIISASIMLPTEQNAEECDARLTGRAGNRSVIVAMQPGT